MRQGTHHALPLLFDGPHEVREVSQRPRDDALVLRHGGAHTRELKLLHAVCQRQLRRAQTCPAHTHHTGVFPPSWKCPCKGGPYYRDQNCTLIHSSQQRMPYYKDQNCTLPFPICFSISMIAAITFSAYAGSYKSNGIVNNICTEHYCYSNNR